MSVKYIFSVNPGRSGSEYSTSIFKHAADCLSVHEDMPILCGELMNDYNNGIEEPMAEAVRRKLVHMESKLKASGKRVLYDSNHCFIKGFGWELVKQVPHEQIGVLMLRRNPEDNAKGLLRVHDVPNANWLSRCWYLRPEQKLNRTRPKENANRLELCRWYVDEIFVRGEEMRASYPSIKFVECTLDDLNNYDRVVEIFKEFGLEELPSLRDAVGKRQNTRKAYPPLDLEAALKTSSGRPFKSLSPHEAGRIRREAAAYLIEKYDMWNTVKPAAGVIPGGAEFLIGGVIPAVMKPGVLEECEEKFDAEIRYTDLEYGLVAEIIYRLREGKWWPLCPFARTVGAPPGAADECADPFPKMEFFNEVPSSGVYAYFFGLAFLNYLKDVLWRPVGTRYAALAVLAAVCFYLLL